MSQIGTMVNLVAPAESPPRPDRSRTENGAEHSSFSELLGNAVDDKEIKRDTKEGESPDTTSCDTAECDGQAHEAENTDSKEKDVTENPDQERKKPDESAESKPPVEEGMTEVELPIVPVNGPETDPAVLPEDIPDDIPDELILGASDLPQQTGAKPKVEGEAAPKAPVEVPVEKGEVLPGQKTGIEGAATELKTAETPKQDAAAEVKPEVMQAVAEVTDKLPKADKESGKKLRVFDGAEVVEVEPKEGKKQASLVAEPQVTRSDVDALPEEGEKVVSWDNLARMTMEQPSNIIRFAPLQQTLKSAGADESAAPEMVVSGLERAAALEAAQAARSPNAVVPDMAAPVQMAERIMKVENLASRFGEQVLSMVKEGEKAMKLHIQPAALGPLTVMVREENSTLSVEIHSHSEMVREMIAKQEDSIRKLMSANDVELEQFDVLLDQQKDPGQRRFEAEEQRETRQEVRGIGPATTSAENVQELRYRPVSRAGSWVA